MKRVIDNIFVLIHQDYNRLGHIGDKNYWFLDPDSYKRYLSMKDSQNKIIDQVKKDETSALIVFPYVLNFFGDYYPYLPKEERNMLETYLYDLAELSNALRDRFAILTNTDFEEKEVPRWKKYLLRDNRRRVTHLKSPKFEENLPFTFSCKNVNIHAFGEYRSQCVAVYGEAICRSLSIPERNFSIVSEASIENIQLIHESETVFFEHLPGSRKEKR